MLKSLKNKSIESFNDQTTTYVCDDSELSQHVKNFEPDANIFRPFSHSPPRFADKLLGI